MWPISRSVAKAADVSRRRDASFSPFLCYLRSLLFKPPVVISEECRLFLGLFGVRERDWAIGLVRPPGRLIYVAIFPLRLSQNPVPTASIAAVPPQCFTNLDVTESGSLYVVARPLIAEHTRAAPQSY